MREGRIFSNSVIGNHIKISVREDLQSILLTISYEAILKYLKAGRFFCVTHLQIYSAEYLLTMQDFFLWNKVQKAVVQCL